MKATCLITAAWPWFCWWAVFGLFLLVSMDNLQKWNIHLTFLKSAKIEANSNSCCETYLKENSKLVIFLIDFCNNFKSAMYDDVFCSLKTDEVKRCLKNRNTNYVVADNFYGIINASKHFKQKAYGESNICFTYLDALWISISQFIIIAFWTEMIISSVRRWIYSPVQLHRMGSKDARLSD